MQHLPANLASEAACSSHRSSLLRGLIGRTAIEAAKQDKDFRRLFRRTMNAVGGAPISTKHWLRHVPPRIKGWRRPAATSLGWLTVGPPNSVYCFGILFVALGTVMNEEFRKQHALTVRAMAEKADPFTKKRLLDLADRYDRKPRPPI